MKERKSLQDKICWPDKNQGRIERIDSTEVQKKDETEYDTMVIVTKYI